MNYSFFHVEIKNKKFLRNLIIGQIVLKTELPKLIYQYKNNKKGYQKIVKFSNIQKKYKPLVFESYANYMKSQPELKIDDILIDLKPPQSFEFVDRKKSKLNGSLWFFIRPEIGDPALATAGQLGGSQSGLRLVYPLLKLPNQNSIALSTRLSTGKTPMQVAEAAIGIGVQHQGRVSSEIILERRFKLNEGGRNDFALITTVGVYDVEISPDIKLNAYGQAGIVGVKSRDIFVDIASQADHTITHVDKVSISAGAGAWVSAQPQLSRFDIGPLIASKTRIGQNNIRLSGEWRFRIAGNARPASGPSLTVGIDF